MLNKILYRKDPQLHSFFVDFEKKIFYKCYREDKGQSRFDYEVQCYKKMEGSPHIPKVYNTYKKSDLLIIEMEYIPRLPLYNHPGTEKGILWQEACYTKEQVKSIHNQFDKIKDELKSHGLVEDTNCIRFTFSFFHFIYNEQEDRLIMFDMAVCAPRDIDFLTQCMHEETNSKLKVGDKSTIRTYSDTEMFMELLFPAHSGTIKSDEKLYDEGDDLIKRVEEFKKLGHIGCFHGLWINGKNFGDKGGEEIPSLGIAKNELTGKTVVDTSCGLGSLLTYYIERGAKRVIGMEEDEEACDIARRYVSYMSKIHPLYKSIDVMNTKGIEGWTPDGEVFFHRGVRRHEANSLPK